MATESMITDKIIFGVLSAVVAGGVVFLLFAVSSEGKLRAECDARGGVMGRYGPCIRKEAVIDIQPQKR